LQDEVRDLRKANETLSKRRNRKKSRLQAGGSLNLQEAQALMDKRDIADQLKQEMRGGGSRRRGKKHARDAVATAMRQAIMRALVNL
jgi:hypothetical protein